MNFREKSFELLRVMSPFIVYVLVHIMSDEVARAEVVLGVCMAVLMTLLWRSTQNGFSFIYAILLCISSLSCASCYKSCGWLDSDTVSICTGSIILATVLFGILHVIEFKGRRL